MVKWRKILIITSLCFASILGLMAVLPVFIARPVTESTKQLLNKSINGKLDFGEVHLSFFRHFPNLTITINDFLLMGSAPYEQDTLAAGNQIGFGINLFSLLSDSCEIQKIYINGAQFNIQTGERDSANYNIFRSANEQETPSSGVKESNSGFKIDVIKITNSRFKYYDRSMSLLIKAEDFSYKGKGEMYNDEFNLTSYFSSGMFTFCYDGINYLNKKRLNVEAKTEINLSKWNIRLLENRIKLEDVKAGFTGYFTLMDDGYDVDFHLKTDKCGFRDLFSLIPNEYASWLAETKISGKAQVAVNFKGSARDSLGTSPDLDVSVELADGKLSHADAPYPLENIFLKSSIKMPDLDMNRVEVNLDRLAFKYQGKENYAKVTYIGLKEPKMFADMKGIVDLNALTATLGLNSIKLEGLLEYKASLDGVVNLSAKRLPIVDALIKIKNGGIATPSYPASISNLNVDIAVSSPTGNYTDLNVVIEPVSFTFEGNPFSLKARLSDFNNLNYEIISKGSLNLNNIYKLFSIENATIKGELLTDFNLLGSQSAAKKGKYHELNNSGYLELKNFEFRSKDYRYPFLIPSAMFTFDRERAKIGNTTLNYNQSSISLDGYARNYIGYLLLDENLEGRLSFRSPGIVLDDFTCMFSDENGTKEISPVAVADSVGVIRLPEDLDVEVNAFIKEIVYGQMKARDFSGAVSLSRGALTVSNTGVTLAGAKFRLNAGYKPIASNKADFSLKVKADSFDIRRAYNEIPLFKDLVPSAGSVRGIVSTEYTLKGKLNQQMSPVYPSLKGSGYIKLEDVKVKGFKILGAISKATRRDSINNPHLKSVVIKTSIANNIMKIERTKMKIFGFRPRFEGETSLDGKLNIKFRLGLPPFGIIGIPMTVTGTLDNPKVNLRRSKEGDKLEEEIDESESPALNNPPKN